MWTYNVFTIYLDYELLLGNTILVLGHSTLECHPDFMIYAAEVGWSRKLLLVNKSACVFWFLNLKKIKSWQITKIGVVVVVLVLVVVENIGYFESSSSEFN